jgi:type IV pilus assembly protein PilV
MQQRNRRRARGRQGFTLVEVIISLGVMTIGAMGVIALQQHAIRANSHARQLSMGMQLAQVWMERFKQDAHTWNQPGAPGAVLNQTLYLRAIDGIAPNTFIAIPNSDGFQWPAASGRIIGSRAFNFRGEELSLGAQVNGDIFYCAAFRPAWVYFGRAMRVDVRVWWPREGFDMTLFQNCNANLEQLDQGGPPTTAFNRNSHHVVYLSTVIRMTPVVR